MILDKKSKKKLEESYKTHHSLYKKTNICGNMFEEHVFNALKEGHEVKWNPGSHKPGKDIIVNGLGISCKTTKFTKGRKRLKLSSHRMTSFKSISEKIDFLKKKHEDYYLISAFDNRNNEYSIFSMKSLSDKIEDFKWEEKGKNFYGKLDNIKLKICHSMSSQLWIEIPIEELTLEATIKI